MSFKQTLENEKYVVAYGQPKKFRIIKYIVLISILTALGFWKGWKFSLYFFLSCCGLGIILHFILRFLTKGWTQKWWFVDSIIKK